jgi:hypothetical protein
MVGMALTFTLLALVPLSVISLNGLDNISDVATISWGRALGEWAFFSANLFALCAMLTSYWGLGGSFLTNIFDQFRLGNDEQPARRLMVLLVVAIPPFAGLQRHGLLRQRALFCRGVQRRYFIDYADPDAQGRPPAWRPDAGLDLSGLDDPSAYPMLHCVVVSLQRRLRDSVRGRLPARWLVIRPVLHRVRFMLARFFYLSLICYIARNLVVSNSSE